MTFFDIPLLIIIFALFLIGFVGSIVPGIPGPPVAWIGILLGHWCLLTKTSWVTIIITFVAALIITILDFVLQPWLTKNFGGSKAAVWGATIGLIIGLIFGSAFPPLVLIGPFAGAFIGEVTISGNTLTGSLKSATGAFGEFLLGTGIKMICVAVFLGIIIFEIIKNI